MSRVRRLVTAPVRWSRAAVRRPHRTVAVLAVLAVLAGAGVLWLAIERADRQATRAAESAAVKAAADGVVRALSYDHSSMKEDVAAATRVLTGDFLNDYEKLMNKTVMPAAKEQRTVTRATVVASSVTSATPERVEALLFVNQATTSEELAAPKLDISRVAVTLDQIDGRWLISALRPL